MFSSEYIVKFCFFFEISQDVFWDTIEKFRGDMWTRNSDGEWENKIHQLLNENIEK